MPKEELKRKIQRLHAELENVDKVDEETRTGLRQILADIEGVLGQSEAPSEGKAPSEEHPFRERLDDAAREFEVAHPKAFSLIREIVETLSQAGI